MTYTVPSFGFADVLPKFDPPLLPGMWIVSVNPIGVKMPSLRAALTRCRKRSCCAGVRRYGLMSSAVNVWRANGGGFVGNGCVGHGTSPATSVFVGTGRSSIGQIGAPVTRLNTYMNPVLPAIATASI